MRIFENRLLTFRGLGWAELSQLKVLMDFGNICRSFVGRFAFGEDKIPFVRAQKFENRSLRNPGREKKKNSSNALFSKSCQMH